MRMSFRSFSNAVRYWVEYFGIDGIRLDVAYCLDMDFVRRLRSFTDELGREQGREIFLVGEMLHGDYNRLVNDENATFGYQL